MAPPSSKRVKANPSQTPLRDEFKLNQVADGTDSAWERSSIASGVQPSQSGAQHSERLSLSEMLPVP